MKIRINVYKLARHARYATAGVLAVGSYMEAGLITALGFMWFFVALELAGDDRGELWDAFYTVLTHKLVKEVTEESEEVVGE